MAMTKLVFGLTTSDDGRMSLVLEKNLLAPDAWTAQDDPADCLVLGAGLVDSSDPVGLICHNGSEPRTIIITLSGASWNSQVGDTGGATCDGCQSCGVDWDWEVTSRN